MKGPKLAPRTGILLTLILSVAGAVPVGWTVGQARGWGTGIVWGLGAFLTIWLAFAFSFWGSAWLRGGRR